MAPWQSELAALRFHWGRAYEITRSNGMFRAVRRDDGLAVSAPTGDSIRAQIRADYLARPVLRDT